MCVALLICPKTSMSPECHWIAAIFFGRLHSFLPTTAVWNMFNFSRLGVCLKTSISPELRNWKWALCPLNHMFIPVTCVPCTLIKVALTVCSNTLMSPEYHCVRHESIHFKPWNTYLWRGCGQHWQKLFLEWTQSRRCPLKEMCDFWIFTSKGRSNAGII